MDNHLNPANVHMQRCPRCQAPLNTVVVHGHEQCITCKSNIFECCSGDTCETDQSLAVGYKRGWWCTCPLLVSKQINSMLLWSFGFSLFPHLALHKKLIIYCFVSNNSKNIYKHALTVWDTKTHMLSYARSPKDLKAIRAFSSIAIGRLLSYESDVIPSWDAALLKRELEARDG